MSITIVRVLWTNRNDVLHGGKRKKWLASVTLVSAVIKRVLDYNGGFNEGSSGFRVKMASPNWTFL